MLNTDLQSWDSKKLQKHLKEIQELLKNSLEQNVRIACEEALLTAKAETPPKGEPRGRNTVTGKMAESWSYRYTINDSGDVAVTFENSQPYAPFVDKGHKVPRHFVPWLYVDDSGLIARHIPVSGEKLFGLVVGTRTQYVEGANVTQKATDRFNEVFDELSEKTLEEVGAILNS